MITRQMILIFESNSILYYQYMLNKIYSIYLNAYFILLSEPGEECLHITILLLFAPDKKVFPWRGDMLLYKD